MLSITYIDHYDSFTYNLLAWLEEAPYDVRIKRVAFDDGLAMAAVAASGEPLILSPGPKSPAEASATLALVRQKLTQVPILGVCLGHQILATVAGFTVSPSRWPCHGAVKEVWIAEDSAFLAGLSNPSSMAAYHSLVATEAGLSKDAKVGAGWAVAARCAHGEVQALEFRPVAGAWALGVQFHPESFLSQGAAPLRANWYRYLRSWQQRSCQQTLAPPS